MIELPKRSVTRFFVPLIDVLILLFCIFLLLPFVSKPDAEKQLTDADPMNTDDPGTLKELLLIERARNNALMMERANTADRTMVVALEIDADTGKLFTLQKDGFLPKRIEIAKHEDAIVLIERQKQISQGKTPYFLLQYPRKISSYPLQNQIDEYRRWFKDVAYGVDNPWSGNP